MKDKRLPFFIAGITSTLSYIYLFYFVERHESFLLSILYLLLFAGYGLVIYYGKSIRVRDILSLAVLFRLVPFLAIPALSDDFYRFIWDGIIWSNDINPFAYTPVQVVEDRLIELSQFELGIFSQLNSQVTYTVYPTLPQVINLTAIKVFPNSLILNVVVMRMTIITAEFFSLFLLVRILDRYKKPRFLVSLYALNPLVIIELTGNLHHEALMIVFFLGFILLNLSKKTMGAGSLLALAIASKLLPLMFLPYIIIKQKPGTKFLGSFFITLIILFFPLVDASFIDGMRSSLSLYYQRFEFNAGLYYLVREIGYWFYGYNAIAVIGKLFFIISLVLIGVVSFRALKLKDPLAYTLIYTVFALFSLILHPWYIILLIALVPFTKLKFPIIWSFLIFFSYLGYSENGFQENYLVVFLEYLILGIIMIIDWRSYTLSSATLNEAP